MTEAVSQGVTFAEEAIVDTWDEALPMTREHQLEVGYLPTDEFEPDKERFVLLERGGFMRTFTARVGGKLVGYAIFWVHSDMIYSGLVMATQSVLYVAPAHRGPSKLAMEFMLYQDESLKANGVDCILRHVSERNDYSRSLMKMAYAKIETTFLRRV